jgi:hypothetical protein
MVEELDKNMPQVDMTSYIPLLFWFVLFLSIFYYINFTRLLPLIFTLFFVRKSYYEDFLKSILASMRLVNVMNCINNLKEKDKFTEIIKIYQKLRNNKNFLLLKTIILLLWKK